MDPLSAAAAAEMLGGELVRGDGVTLSAPGSLSGAAPGQFVYAAGRRAFLTACEGGASLVLSSGEFSKTDKPLIILPDPKAAYIRLLRYFEEKPVFQPGLTHGSLVPSSAEIDPTVHIGPFVRIGSGVRLESGAVVLAGAVIHDGVVVGADSVLRENSVLYSRTVVGSGVDVGPGTIIGSEGFGFEAASAGWERVPQLGGVIVEDGVRIGANCTIDRATAGNTVIGRGTRIDNLVHIAHNVRIGPGNLILAQAGIAGSVVTGSRCIIGGQVGIADHCRIGDNVTIGSKSGVQRHALKSDTMYWGNPALEMNTSKKINAAMKDLPAIAAWWRARSNP